MQVTYKLFCHTMRLAHKYNRQGMTRESTELLCSCSIVIISEHFNAREFDSLTFFQ
jgi:hypothetical protein